MSNSKQHLKTAGSLLVAAMLMCSLFSCSSSRKASRKSAAEARQIEQIIENASSFKTLESKVTLSINGQSVAGQLRIAKDSCFWLSIQPFLGIEAFRVFVTPGRQLVVIDRLNKQYAVQDLNQTTLPEAASLLGILTYTLSNSVFLPESKLRSASDYQISASDDQRYRLSVPFHQNTLQYFFDRELNYVAADIYSQYTDGPVHVAYTGFQSTVAGPFPYHMQATATVGSRMFSLGCDFQRPVFDSAPRFDTSIPSNYQPFDLFTLLKALL